MTTFGQLNAPASCVNFAVGPSLTKTKIAITWQGMNAKGKLVAVGKDVVQVASATLTSLDPATYTVVSAPVVKGSFVTHTIVMNFAFDGEYADLNNACAGAGISALTFGNQYTSTIAVT